MATGDGGGMAWLYLVIAGLLEVGWAVGLKHTHGFTKLWPSVFIIIGMAASFFFLSVSAREIPIGTAYSVWAGIGAVGTVLVGMMCMGEPIHALRVAFLAMIVVGILGIKLVS